MEKGMHPKMRRNRFPNGNIVWVYRWANRHILVLFFVIGFTIRASGYRGGTSTYRRVGREKQKIPTSTKVRAHRLTADALRAL